VREKERKKGGRGDWRRVKKLTNRKDKKRDEFQKDRVE
jgi:hypothetical protein